MKRCVSMKRRVIAVPSVAGWPIEIELRERGGSLVRFNDGRQQTFWLESDLLRAFGWTWDDLRIWTVNEAHMSWYTG